MRLSPPWFAPLMAAAAALSLSACDGNGTDSDPETETIAPGEVSAGDLPDASANAVALAPQEFVGTMAGNDRFELESARIIQTKSPAAPVRDFAAMMIRDHSGSTDRLRAIVGDTSALAMPAEAVLTAAQRTQLDQLRTASGSDAVALYLRQQVTAHEAALSTLAAFAAHGRHDGLQDFAAATARTVRAHLDRARSLAGQDDGVASGGGAAGGTNNPNGPGTSAPRASRNTSAGTGTDTAPVGPTAAPPR